MEDFKRCKEAVPKLRMQQILKCRRWQQQHVVTVVNMQTDHHGFLSVSIAGCPLLAQILHHEPNPHMCSHWLATESG